MLKYVVCLCKGCDGFVFSVCIVTREAFFPIFVYGMCEWSVMQMLYACVYCESCVSSHAAFCMTCSLLMLVEDGRGMLQSRSHDCLVGNHECLLLFTPSCCDESFYHL